MADSGKTSSDRFADPTFMLLTTFRRPRDGQTTGTPVATPVWVVRDGDLLFVTTHGKLGKTKRIRHTPTVTLQACDARGRVKDGAPLVDGEAQVHADGPMFERMRRVVRRRHPVQYPVVGALAGLKKSAGPEVALVIRTVA